MDSFGLSTTYRVVWIPAGPRPLSAAEVGRRLFGPVVAAGRGSSLLLGNGGRLRLDVAGQPEYFAAQGGADAVAGRVLGLWQRALDAIEAGNLEAIAREIDWVSKYQLIERYRAEHDLPLSAPEVARADVAFSDVDRDRGLYYRLQRRGEVERTARDIDIFEAKTVPPAPGRYRQAG